MTSKPATLWTLFGGKLVLAVRPEGWGGVLTFVIGNDKRDECRLLFKQEPTPRGSPYVFKLWYGARHQGDPDLRGVEYVKYVLDDFLAVCPRSRVYEVKPEPVPSVPNQHGFLPVGPNWNDQSIGTFLEVATLADLTVLRMMD
jgi:hypothetical protein